MMQFPFTALLQIVYERIHHGSAVENPGLWAVKASDHAACQNDLPIRYTRIKPFVALLAML